MAKKRSTKGGGHRRGPHSSWKGMLRVNLVTIPVQAYNVVAPDQGEIHFHQLHAKCHSRIQYKKVCPKHGEVSADEIVPGYEYRKGEYVEIEPEELDKLRTKADKALNVDVFIDPEAFDLKYLDGRNYYLVPDGPFASESYAVLYGAMEKLKKWGVGQVVFSEREQIVLIRADNNAICMSLLHHAAEVRSPSDLGIGKPHAAAQKLNLAKAVVEAQSTEKFDFSDYHDRYQEQLQKLIDSKVKGKEIVAPEEEEDEAEVINLMDALRKSLEHSHSRRTKSTGTSRSATPKRKVKRKAS